MGSMTGTDAVPLWRAADLLDLDVEEVFDLVVSGRLRVVRRENGRPLVTLDAIERYRTDREHATP